MIIDEMKTIHVDGVGDVDTVTGENEEGHTYYYSKDLGFNLKIENQAQTWTLTKFEKNVSEEFPHTLPDTSK